MRAGHRAGREDYSAGRRPGTSQLGSRREVGEGHVYIATASHVNVFFYAAPHRSYRARVLRLEGGNPAGTYTDNQGNAGVMWGMCAGRLVLKVYQGVVACDFTSSPAAGKPSRVR
jgi:hypothetical protein